MGVEHASVFAEILVRGVAEALEKARGELTSFAFDGMALGLGLSYWLQEQGMDISPFLKNSSMMISDVLHARITPVSWYIGFVPGLVATLLGSAIAGRGIYRRETATLTKELQE